MLNDRLKSRLAKDRPMTSITLRIPVDVVESMKSIAPQRGFSGYATMRCAAARRPRSPAGASTSRRSPKVRPLTGASCRTPELLARG